MKTERPCRVAIIGTGAIAHRMSSAIRASGGATAVAVVSSSLNRALEFSRVHGCQHAFANLDDLARSGVADMVYVANATDLHAGAAVEALERGFPVLCEKPMAVSLQQVNRVVDVARRTRLLFMEGLWTHMLPSWREAKAIALSGEIGEIQWLQADFSYPLEKLSGGRIPSAWRDGVLLDRAIYVVSLAVSLLGPVVQVRNTTGRVASDDSGVALLDLVHQGGQVSSLSASLTSLGTNSACISGTRGRIDILEPLLGSESIRLTGAVLGASEVPAGSGSLSGILAAARRKPLLRRAKRVLQGMMSTPLPYGADQYGPMWRHYLDCLRTGRVESDIIPLAHSLEVASVLERARLSP